MDPSTSSPTAGLIPAIRNTIRVFFTLQVLLLGACGEAEKSVPESHFIELREQFNSLHVENQDLRQELSRFQDRLARLEAEYENLKIKEADLSRWSRKLATAYGPAIWYFGMGERPLPMQPIPQATVTGLIAELNRLLRRDGWPLVIFEKVDGQTAYVRVSDGEQLTQHMGTAGATAFIEAVTYTLTSLKSLDFVEFRFAEGDHAIPGRYSR